MVTYSAQPFHFSGKSVQLIHHKQESRMRKEKLYRLWRGKNLAKESTYEKSWHPKSSRGPVFCRPTLCAQAPSMCGFMPSERNYNNSVQTVQQHESTWFSAMRACHSLLASYKWHGGLSPRLQKHPKAASFTFINSCNSESADHQFYQVAAKVLHEILQDTPRKQWIYTISYL